MSRRLLALQSLLLAVLVTWPAPLYLTTRAVGSIESDTPKHIWTLWWMREELLHGVSGLQTTLVNFPTGMPLYPIEPLHGVLALLLPIGPVALSNVLALLHVFLTGMCAGWLGWLCTNRQTGALVAGAFAQGCTFTAFTLHVGVGELREFWWLPLGMAVLLKAQATRAPRWFVALGGVLAGATLSCFYHGFFLATAVAIHALLTLRADRRLLLGYLGAAALSLAVVLPVARAFASSYAPEDARPHAGFVAWMRDRYEVETHPGSALELQELVTWREVPYSDATRQEYAYGGGRYFGVFAFALAALGAFAVPRRTYPWVAIAGVGFVLAMGTVVWWQGQLLEPRVVLPLTWLNRALAYVAEPLNFPVRFLALPSLAFAVLAAHAVRWRWAIPLVPLAILDMAMNDPIPWPRDTMAVPSVAPLQAPEGAVADLTFATRREFGSVPLANLYDPPSRARLIGAQLGLDRPFQLVPVERVERWGMGGYAWSAALPLAAALHGDPVSEDDLRASFGLLRHAGFGSFVVTHPCGQAPERTPLHTRIGPPEDGRCAFLWKVPDVHATVEELARWGSEQQLRVARVERDALAPMYAPTEPPRP